MLPNQEERQKWSNNQTWVWGKGVEGLKLVINIPVNILYGIDVTTSGNRSDLRMIKSQGQ